MPDHMLTNPPSNTTAPKASNSGYGDSQNRNGAVKKAVTEDQLINQLNEQSKSTFKSLSPEGKALALKLASQSCKGNNECKGLNSCKSDKNSCAGQGSCAGQSSCAFKDKNTAVKVAAKKLADKRAILNSH